MNTKRPNAHSIREALDPGIKWIDTAAVYGVGHSEEVVARGLGGVRDRPSIFPRCSIVWDKRRKIGHSLKAFVVKMMAFVVVMAFVMAFVIIMVLVMADSMRRECETSLWRLREDAPDLYQIYWSDPDEDIEQGWGGPGRASEAGQGPPQRRVQLQRRPDQAGAGDLGGKEVGSY